MASFPVPFTAGGFIYIAGSDLMPELKKHATITNSVVQLISLSLGILLMIVLLMLEH